MSTEKKTVLTHEEICRVGVRKLKERKKSGKFQSGYNKSDKGKKRFGK